MQLIGKNKKHTPHTQTLKETCLLYCKQVPLWVKIDAVIDKMEEVSPWMEALSRELLSHVV